MINIDLEKNKTMTTQDICDIISFSLSAANVNGYTNEYLFERALYLHLAVVLYPDRNQELTTGIVNDLAGTWDNLVADGTIETMMKENKLELDMLADIASSWIDNYNDYNLSMRGILDTMNFFTGDMVQNAANALRATAQETGVKDVINIADKWGMNNTIETSVDDDRDLPEGSLL